MLNKGMKQISISDTEIIDAYNKYQHLGKIAAHFGVPNISIWRRCKMLGLKFKSGGKVQQIDLSEILQGLHPHYNTGHLKRRLLKEGIKENVCEIDGCNITEWNSKPIIMQIDHINGNPTDHRLENLRMICPNCHSQTETYCGKNK